LIRPLPEGAAPNSHRTRGAIASFKEGIAKKIGYEYGIIITLHKYSARPEAFVTLIPLQADVEAEHEYDFDITDPQPWFEFCHNPKDPVPLSMVAAIPNLLTLQVGQLAEIPTHYTVDPALLERLEMNLLRWFGLPSAAPAPTSEAATLPADPTVTPIGQATPIATVADTATRKPTDEPPAM
jgi:hypothetical protein